MRARPLSLCSLALELNLHPAGSRSTIIRSIIINQDLPCTQTLQVHLQSAYLKSSETVTARVFPSFLALYQGVLKYYIDRFYIYDVHFIRAKRYLKDYNETVLYVALSWAT